MKVRIVFCGDFTLAREYCYSLTGYCGKKGNSETQGDPIAQNPLWNTIPNREPV